MFRTHFSLCFTALSLFVATELKATNLPVLTPQPFWNWAQTPPLGWNSYDAFGSSVTEAETMENAHYMKDHLAAYGWSYIIVDYRWYDAHAKDQPLNGKAGNPIEMDSNGRAIPAANRFPSATNGVGFKALADQIHGLGLKFGIHMMRGLPAQAYAAASPIVDSTFTAKDASDGKCSCTWCKDMVDVLDNPAGQAWYNAEAKQWAAWGLDFVKVDDLSRPYHTGEIEMIRKAIDACGRPIVFSTSPGQTPLKQGEHVAEHANQWRISDDFWDNWASLNKNFDLFAGWQPFCSPGHFPDGDMIPFGRIGIRSIGHDRKTKFTPDEQQTLISLWALESSPLMLGCNLPDLDADTEKLLTNKEVLAIDQDPKAEAGERDLVGKYPTGVEQWDKSLQGDDYAIGVFNRGDQPVTFNINWSDLGMVGNAKDLWSGEMIKTDKPLSVTLAPHASRLFRLSKQY